MPILGLGGSALTPVLLRGVLLRGVLRTLRPLVTDQSGVARVLEIDRGYGRSPPHSSIVLVCQANFRAAWRTKNRFDHFSRFVFAVCPHTNNSSQSHFKCVLVHDSPRDCWLHQKMTSGVAISEGVL